MISYHEYFYAHPLQAYYIMAFLVVVPVARIFKRAGFPFWYAALLAVPYVGIAGCAVVLAMRPWPIKKGENVYE